MFASASSSFSSAVTSTKAGLLTTLERGRGASGLNCLPFAVFLVYIRHLSNTSYLRLKLKGQRVSQYLPREVAANPVNYATTVPTENPLDRPLKNPRQ